jgi:peptide/nickel transport system substrate-binding protein
VVALVATACGDDDDDDAGEATTTAASTSASGTSAPTSTGATTGATTAEAVVGGAATILQGSDIGSMDAVSAVGSSGTDGMRMFAVYGALVVLDTVNFEIVPVLAESLEPNADFTTWTLTLRDGLVFSDGTPFDADAVRVNWERVKDPANRSPGAGAAAAIASTTVVDDRTLTVTLAAPNAQFPNSVSRNALNYIASPTAIAGGHDLINQPIGAGPFLFDEWLRDDHITFVRNPKWYDTPRPYLDELTIRFVPDLSQRTDTFIKGDADAFLTTNDAENERAIDEGGEYIGVTMASGFSVLFNESVKPFDDVRVRRAVAMAIDRDAVAEVAYPGTPGAQNYTVEGTPFFNADAVVPAYDRQAAQQLVDELTAELGGPIKFSLLGTPGSQNAKGREFMQTMLNQIDGFEVETESIDLATYVPRILQGDFGVATWGYPWRDPDPLIYQNFFGGLRSNLGRYTNASVDTAFAAARSTNDEAQRTAHWSSAFATIAADVPYVPIVNVNQGYVVSPGLEGVEIWEDGTARPDLLWRSA